MPLLIPGGVFYLFRIQTARECKSVTVTLVVNKR